MNQNIHYLKPYTWLQQGSFNTIDTYKKLVNWLSGEFTLYQQEEVNGLTVFFPNGWFSIKKVKMNHTTIKFEIAIKSKCIKNGVLIKNRIQIIFNHLENLQNH